jgi:hypothetical protein
MSLVAQYPAISHRQVAIRLADEGIPVRAISRTLALPSEDVREILAEARDAGAIVELPRDDWPPNVSRNQRLPGLASLAAIDDELILLNLVRLFKLTPQQALLLLVLLKRREVTRKQMHAAIESRRGGPKEETDKKIVDVVVCKLRKRLKTFGLEIETVWAWGYVMPTEHRKKALQLLNEFMEGSGSLKVEE